MSENKNVVFSPKVGDRVRTLPRNGLRGGYEFVVVGIGAETGRAYDGSGFTWLPEELEPVSDTPKFQGLEAQIRAVVVPDRVLRDRAGSVGLAARHDLPPPPRVHRERSETRSWEPGYNELDLLARDA
jgi:hypothetical protein